MTVPSDPYNFTNGTTADADQVDARFLPLYTALNGALDVDNLLAAVKQKLGLSDASVVRRGKAIISSEEARTNTAYGLLGTPDQVTNVVVPTDGLLFVSYRAMWKESSVTDARAAIFLGANQMTTWVTASATNVVQEADLGGTINTYGALASTPRGLVGDWSSAGGIPVPATTGQAIGVTANTTDTTDFFGGVCVLEPDAGTYDVSVRFKTIAGGTVTVKQRRLRVWTMAF